jgi:hypothetical protein
MNTQDAGTTSQQVGLVAAVWRFRWVTLAFLLVGGLLAAYVTLSANDASRAKATVALTDPRGNSIFRQGSSANVDLTRYTAERAAFAESVAVLQRAAEILADGSTSSTIDEVVEVKPRPDTSILVINAEAADPDDATAVADAVATAYQELALAETRQKADLALAGLDAQRQEALAVINDPTSTSAEVAAGTQTLSTVNARAAEIESAAELFGNGVAFADPAQLEAGGGKVELLRNAAAGAMIGLVLGAALSWVLADRRQRAQHAPDLHDELGSDDDRDDDQLDEPQPTSPRSDDRRRRGAKLAPVPEPERGEPASRRETDPAPSSATARAASQMGPAATRRPFQPERLG